MRGRRRCLAGVFHWPRKAAMTFSGRLLVVKPKKCKGCGRPVRETAGGTGYCKKCIAKAREGRKP